MSSAKATKKSAFSCEPCRRRKVRSPPACAELTMLRSWPDLRVEFRELIWWFRQVKCGGEQPVCQRCAARNDECIYKLYVPIPSETAAGGTVSRRQLFACVSEARLTGSAICAYAGTRPCPTRSAWSSASKISRSSWPRSTNHLPRLPPLHIQAPP